jgi:transcriptional regulator with XRE-family HTH domain
MTLGERIRAARERLPGMTQKKLGVLLGVSYQAVSQWERGEDRPDVDKYPQLRYALRVNFAWLHCGDGVPPDPEAPEVIMDDMATSVPLHVRSSVAKAILGLRKRS